MSFNLLGTNGFHPNAQNQRFAAAAWRFRNCELFPTSVKENFNVFKCVLIDNFVSQLMNHILLFKDKINAFNFVQYYFHKIENDFPGCLPFCFLLFSLYISLLPCAVSFRIIVLYLLFASCFFQAHSGFIFALVAVPAIPGFLCLL